MQMHDPYAITKQDMISKLNLDVANEYKHMLVYLHFATTVEGLHRVELAEFWMEAARSEMDHVAEFSRVVLGLGGQPTRFPLGRLYDNEQGQVVSAGPSFPYMANAQEQVQFALAMEDEVVANYVQRLNDADALGGVDGTYVRLFIEDQILDSRTDADRLREMAKRG
jgi:bacterioferritin (cytochrome b1)